MSSTQEDDYQLIAGSEFFSAEWYLNSYEDVQVANLDPVAHYLATGAAQGRDPSPLFSTKSYLARRPDVAFQNINPLVHFLKCGLIEGEELQTREEILTAEARQQCKRIGASGWFDAVWYLTQYPDVRAAGLDPLEHYLTNGAGEGRDPGPRFSTSWYLHIRPDVAAAGLNPLVHFVEHGAREGVDPMPDAWNSLLERNVVLPRFGMEIDRSPNRTKIFVVTHDTSRTGAPLIIKTLVSYFALNSDCEVFTFCLGVGDIFPEFRLYSHVIDCTQLNLLQSSLGIDRLVEGLGGGVSLAICNTANVNHYAARFKRNSIPVITLVHEALTRYDEEYLTSMFDVSDRMVFPAESVQSIANDRIPIPAGKGKVIPQGLLDKRFGSRTHANIRAAVRRELGLSAESVIVIGCGTVIQRKGVDLFVSVAQKCFALSDKEIHFVWIGSRIADRSFDDWTARDIKASGWEGRIHLIGERADPAPYYKAADIFALTSREDPFPCVLHEAMVCGLPIIAFEGAGGAPEALQGGCGVVVPYRDLDAMASEIAALSGDEHRRLSIGDAARNRVAERYDFQSYFSAIVKLAEDELSVSLGVVRTGRAAAERPRVLFFNRDWWISGVNSFTETLMKGLIANGIDAELIFPECPMHDVNYIPNVPHRLLRLEGMPLKHQWRNLMEFCEQQSPCVLVPNYDYLTSAISPALSSKVGILGILHSDDVEHYDHANRLGRYWNRFVCSTRYLAENLSEINPQFAQRVDVIPYGVPVPEKPARQPAERSRPLRIVFCARLMQHQKRALDLVKITEELEQRSISYQLTVIGEGSEEGQLKSAWKRQIRLGSVIMTGRLSHEDMLSELAKNEVFLLVSEFEGMPISLLEAMARGLVPIVSDIPAGIPELVLPGQTGFIAAVGDTRKFAEHIATLSADRTLLDRLSDEAYSHIRNNGFTNDAMSESYQRVLEKIWTDVVTGEYRRPRSLVWRGPCGDVSAPGFTLKLDR
jgi:glycosyltransferase involved in cell wall biosynthesis